MDRLGSFCTVIESLDGCARCRGIETARQRLCSTRIRARCRLHDNKFLLRGDTFLFEVWGDSNDGRIVLLINLFAQSR
ncbi:hypothetical protein [Mycetohabitans sp. B46]|uniref:hypothetical protein n=1 Tax=Mycetohabitans sp. B46 TaxID=2772536 RepID=UPI00307FC6D6